MIPEQALRVAETLMLAFGGVDVKCGDDGAVVVRRAG